MDRNPSEALEQRARRFGPLPYSDLAPAPVGPQPGLAEWLASAIDGWWNEAGQPDPYSVVEVGAGDGSRAREVLEMGPECLRALRYVVVDPSFEAQQSALLPLESPAFLFPAGPTDSDEPGEPPPPAVGIGPLVTSLAEVPVIEGFAAILAIGWLSRLPSDRLEWRDGRWWEIRLAASPGEGLEEVAVLTPEGAWVPAYPAAQGDRVAVLQPAAQWLAATLSTAAAGVLAVVDHWTVESGPAARGSTPPLALDQFAPIRRPVDDEPEPVGAGLSVVCWRLG